jgi:hypothetical protein
LDIFCAAIGSVSGNNFGWFGRLSDGTAISGTDITAFVTELAKRLNGGNRVALGFEAPMFIPLRENPLELTRCRRGETTPNWIGGPGGAVLATAMAQVPWILGDLKPRLSLRINATTDWTHFKSKHSEIFLWEAFVCGVAKGTSHVADAEVAVRAFLATLPDPPASNAIHEPSVTSILGLALLRTGWSKDISFLQHSCVVIKAQPPPHATPPPPLT